jgi:phosphatidylcholine synthase
VTAWAVHLFTASGALVAFLSLRAAGSGDYREAFLWLAVATMIDAGDGVLARLARVKERTPAFDGARLDDIVDYLTFVFVPAWLIYAAGRLPDALALVTVAAVLLSSAFGFSQAHAKTSDHFFTGFPSYWNIVVFYLFVLDLGRGATAAVLLAFAALVFVPIGYVYPSRTPTLRTVTVLLGLAWGFAMLAMIWQYPAVAPQLAWASLLFPVYYLVLSLVLHSQRRDSSIVTRHSSIR